MGRAITDTGPVLHLHEIGWLKSLKVFDLLEMPDLVAEELRIYKLNPTQLDSIGLNVIVTPVPRNEWEPLIDKVDRTAIQPADAQVLVLAQLNRFRDPVLTDDLVLRRRLEDHQALVIGSIGILIRAYTTGHLSRTDLENAVEALLTTSSLHMSPSFRRYISHLITTLP